MRAFQADVPNGSMCIPVPDLDGPITTHLYGGLLASLKLGISVILVLFYFSRIISVTEIRRQVSYIHISLFTCSIERGRHGNILVVGSPLTASFFSHAVIFMLYDM